MNLGRNLPIRSAEDVGLITEVRDLQLAAERLDVGSEGVDLADHLDVCGVLPLPQLGEAMLTGGQDHRLGPLLDLVPFGIGKAGDLGRPIALHEATRAECVVTTCRLAISPSRPCRSQVLSPAN